MRKLPQLEMIILVSYSVYVPNISHRKFFTIHLSRRNGNDVTTRILEIGFTGSLHYAKYKLAQGRKLLRRRRFTGQLWP